MEFKYVCNECQKEFSSEKVVYTCPSCSTQKPNTFRKGNLRVMLEESYLKSLKDKKDLCVEDFYPYPPLSSEAFPVGPTSIVRPLKLGRSIGLDNLILKADSQLLSGSYKDRASLLVAYQALYHNERKIALASTGNAGAAMSCVGAAFDLDVILFVPENAPIGKLMQSVLYGATVVPIKGSYDDAFELSLYYSRHFGGINRNTGYNPMTVEGKKSLSIELYLQLKDEMPQIIYVPVGDGSIYSGVCKGLFDLKRAGLIEKIPYVVAVQSTSSNAIAQAFKTKEFFDVNATTRADSINVNSPASGRMAVSYLQETKSWVSQVTDNQILDAQLELAKESGVFVEPAAAAAWAALKQEHKMLIELFGNGVSVCVLLTGSGFKDMGVFDNRIKLPSSIENSKEAVDLLFSK